MAPGCTPFANNQIPAGRIDPIAAAFLNNVPRATSSAEVQNLTSVEESTRTINQISGRVDHRLTDADQLFVRFSTFDADELQPFGTSAQQEALVPGFGRTLGTTTQNLTASHTRVFGRALLNELRFGYMHVDGGQESVNAGVDFAGQVGLAGVTSDPRDVGYPQITTRGLYSTMGDPATFVSRRNQHFELYDNVTLDRGRHRVKFGGYYFHLKLRPQQPDNARGAFTYTGQFSGNAFADFLLGYPTSATSGTGRGDEDGRTNWIHLYAQDDWLVRDNLTLNLGLRYEYNQHMYDVHNRLSSIDLDAPGGRFVVASDENGNIDPSAQELMPLIPLPVVTSAEAGWGRGLLDPSAVRLAPRTGFAWTFNDAKAVDSRWLRHIPEPVGLQRADSVRAQPAVLLHQAGGRAGGRARAIAAHGRHPDEHRHGHGGRQHHGLRLQRGIQPDLERRASSTRSCRPRSSTCPTWGRGRSAPTTPRSATCQSRVPDRSSRGGRFRS